MSHPKLANIFLKNEDRVNWHDKALWFVREKRDVAVNKVKGWEELREVAASIKSNVLSNLDNYLLQFEENAIRNGIKVHWAMNATEHNEIVLKILQENGAKHKVKSKSMLTEECGLNQYLENSGIEVIDTDLGERIVQLANEPPSHIVLPAIHKRKEEIDALFVEKWGIKGGNGNAEYLTREARKHLREKFLIADAAITGVNFAIAENGGFVVCTNEGNADMGTHLANIHIACMGIEKIIPKMEHLGVFLRLLARSATGQPITTYSSHFFKPRPGTQLHVVIVDNGRSQLLGRPEFRKSLHCIRCGACLNTCPVFRKTGGYSYESVIPGPIGSILGPGIDMEKYNSLPFASTLCGSCTDVCPVKIDIHSQLYKWRQIISPKKGTSIKKLAARVTGKIFGNPILFRLAATIGTGFLRFLPGSLTKNLTAWGKGRELPKVPKQSFRDWYIKNRKE